MSTAKSRRLRTFRSGPIWLQLYLLGTIGLGLTALFGGGRLVLDPSGRSMNMPLDWLVGTPFADYLIPGLILFSILGVGSFVVLALILLRSRLAWPGAVGLGVILVGWIAIQMLLIQMVHLLHVLYAGLGILLVILALTPSVRAELIG